MHRWTGHLIILLLALASTAAERGALAVGLWVLVGLVAALIAMAGTSWLIHQASRGRRP